MPSSAAGVQAAAGARWEREKTGRWMPASWNGDRPRQAVHNPVRFTVPLFAPPSSPPTRDASRPSLHPHRRPPHLFVTVVGVLERIVLAALASHEIISCSFRCSYLPLHDRLLFSRLSWNQIFRRMTCWPASPRMSFISLFVLTLLLIPNTTRSSKAPVVRGARACTVCRAAKVRAFCASNDLSDPLQMKCVGAEDGTQPCQRCKRSNSEFVPPLSYSDRLLLTRL